MARDSYIVVKAGTITAKQLERLRDGEGIVAAQVDEAVALAKGQLGEDGQGQVILPIVVVYRRKSKRRRKGLASMLFGL